MLDSTVHRTLLQNQHMQEDVAVMSQRVEQTVGQNKGLLAQRKALQLELRVQQEMGQQHVQRALASQQLGKTVAEARALGELEAAALKAQLRQATSTLQTRDEEVSALQARLAAADERAAALGRQNRQQAELLQARLVGRSPPPTPPLPDWDEVFAAARGGTPREPAPASQEREREAPSEPKAPSPPRAATVRVPQKNESAGVLSTRGAPRTTTAAAAAAAGLVTATSSSTSHHKRPGSAARLPAPPASARPDARRPSSRSGATAAAAAAAGAAAAAAADGAGSVARDGAATAREIREIASAPRMWHGTREKRSTSHEGGFGGVLKAALEASALAKEMAVASALVARQVGYKHRHHPHLPHRQPRRQPHLTLTASLPLAFTLSPPPFSNPPSPSSSPSSSP